MTTSFTFHYPTDATDLLIEAHREGDEIELDHVWLRDTAGTGYMDILPVLKYEEEMHSSWLLDRIYEKAEAERAAGWKRSLMA